MRNRNFDIVIIGAGLVGTSIAYYSGKNGQKVCVVEKGVAGRESSGRCGGVIKPSHQSDVQRPVAKRATELWREIDEESDLDFEYREHGYIRLAYSEADIEKITALTERDRAIGIEVSFLNEEETRTIVPSMTEKYIASTYDPAGGSAEPYLASEAMCRLAKRHGVSVYEYTEVTGIEVVNDRVSAVLTNRGPISAGVIVNCANAWAPEIGRMVGLKLPIEVQRSHLHVTEALPPFLGPAVTTERYGYFLQTASGNIAMGFPARPQEGFEGRVTYEAITTVSRRLTSLIPRLRSVSMLRSHTGFTVWTPDYLALVGPVTQIEGMYVAAGFCGLGFQIGPTIGEQVAEMILNGRTTVPMDGYLPERFDIYQK